MRQLWRGIARNVSSLCPETKRVCTHAHTHAPMRWLTCNVISNNILHECAFSAAAVDAVGCMSSFCSVFKSVVRVNPRTQGCHRNASRAQLTRQRQRDENGQDKLVCDDFCLSSSSLLASEASCHNATLCKLVSANPNADCLY